MPKSTKRFVLSNENLNEDDFKIITSGVDISFFKSDRQLYWMLDCFGVNLTTNIMPGSFWTDIQVINNEITAIPFFNDNDQVAMKLYHKVEHGTLRAVNVIFDYIELDTDKSNWDKGQKLPTVLKSKLIQASLSDGIHFDNSTAVHAEDNVICLKSLRTNNNNNIHLFNTPTNLMNNNIDKFPDFQQSGHSPKTKAMLKNAVDVGKFTQEFANGLADVTLPENPEMVDDLTKTIMRTKIKPKNVEGKFNDKLLKKAATKSYDEIHVEDCQLRGMKEAEPELYKAKFFEKFGRLPADVA